jgi:hypothetical protein
MKFSSAILVGFTLVAVWELGLEVSDSCGSIEGVLELGRCGSHTRRKPSGHGCEAPTHWAVDGGALKQIGKSFNTVVARRELSER